MPGSDVNTKGLNFFRHKESGELVSRLARGGSRLDSDSYRLDELDLVTNTDELFQSGRSSAAFGQLAQHAINIQSDVVQPESISQQRFTVTRVLAEALNAQNMAGLGLLKRSRNASQNVGFTAQLDDLKALSDAARTYAVLEQEDLGDFQTLLLALTNRAKSVKTAKEKKEFLKDTASVFDSFISLYDREETASRLSFQLPEQLPHRSAMALDMLCHPTLVFKSDKPDMQAFGLDSELSYLSSMKELSTKTLNFLVSASNDYKDEVKAMKGPMTQYVSKIIESIKGKAEEKLGVFKIDMDEFEACNPILQTHKEAFTAIKDHAMFLAYLDHASILKSCKTLAETFQKTDRKAQRALLTTLSEAAQNSTLLAEESKISAESYRVGKDSSITFWDLTNGVVDTHKAMRPDKTEVNNPALRQGQV